MSDDLLDDVAELDAEEEAAARAFFANRALKALRTAPEIVLYVRSLVGGVERGEEDPLLATPVRVTPLDRADELYTALVGWHAYWAKEFGMTRPWPDAWRTDRQVRGFMPSTPPARAAVLLRDQTRWLTDQHDRITAVPPLLVSDDPVEYIDRALDYFVAIGDLVWTIAGEYPTSPKPDKQASKRRCPDCGEDSVRGEFFRESLTAAEHRGEDLTGLAGAIQVRCELCGWVTSAAKTKIARWLS